MSYYIEKQFDAAVAHRIHNQSLCQVMTGEMRKNPCKCYHGHTSTFLIGLSSDKLVNDLVLDFNMLKFVKRALDEHYDHRFTLCIDDPLFKFLVLEAYDQLIAHAVENGVLSEFAPIEYKLIEDLDGGEHYQTWTVVIPDEVRQLDNPLIELLDSFTITEFTTSSENLAHWMYNVVTNRLKHVYETTTDSYLKDVLSGVKVAKVSYKESPKSIAVYSGE